MTARHRQVPVGGNGILGELLSPDTQPPDSPCFLTPPEAVKGLQILLNVHGRGSESPRLGDKSVLLTHSYSGVRLSARRLLQHQPRQRVIPHAVATNSGTPGRTRRDTVDRGGTRLTGGVVTSVMYRWSSRPSIVPQQAPGRVPGSRISSGRGPMKRPLDDGFPLFVSARGESTAATSTDTSSTSLGNRRDSHRTTRPLLPVQVGRPPPPLVLPDEV